MENKKKILIFNVNWLGDVLFSTATIRNIRQNFPDSFIACIIPPRCQPVLEGNPYLDEIIIFDEEKEHKGLFGKLKFVSYLKKIKFDTVFLLHRSFSRAWITLLAGIPERIGYYTPKRGFLLTKNIKPIDANSLHRIDYYLNIIKDAGLKVSDRKTDFFVGDKDLESVDKFLNDHGISEDDFLVGINPGGNWNPKRWPKDYFIELARSLIKEFSAKVIITGGSKDLPLAEEIRTAVEGQAILACGIFNLKQSAVLYQIFNSFITADTGPLHIANAVGAKNIIALFGPTHPAITGPVPQDNITILQKDVGCKIPCYVVNCQDNRCMKAITPEEAMEKIRYVRAKSL
jgi:lipopolysaccharide heptosyltransferase II